MYTQRSGESTNVTGWRNVRCVSLYFPYTPTRTTRCHADQTHTHTHCDARCQVKAIRVNHLENKSLRRVLFVNEVRVIAFIMFILVFSSFFCESVYEVLVLGTLLLSVFQIYILTYILFLNFKCIFKHLFFYLSYFLPQLLYCRSNTHL